MCVCVFVCVYGATRAMLVHSEQQTMMNNNRHACIHSLEGDESNEVCFTLLFETHHVDDIDKSHFRR